MSAESQDRTEELEKVLKQFTFDPFAEIHFIDIDAWDAAAIVRIHIILDEELQRRAALYNDFDKGSAT